MVSNLIGKTVRYYHNAYGVVVAINNEFMLLVQETDKSLRAISHTSVDEVL